MGERWKRRQMLPQGDAGAASRPEGDLAVGPLSPAPAPRPEQDRLMRMSLHTSGTLHR